MINDYNMELYMRFVCHQQFAVTYILIVDFTDISFMTYAVHLN